MLFINEFVSTSSKNWWKCRFLTFQISFQIIVRKPQKKKKKSNKLRGVNMYQTAMCYISIDSSRHALQNNGKPFSNFGIIF